MVQNWYVVNVRLHVLVESVKEAKTYTEECIVDMVKPGVSLVGGYRVLSARRESDFVDCPEHGLMSKSKFRKHSCKYKQKKVRTQ